MNLDDRIVILLRILAGDRLVVCDSDLDMSACVEV